MYQFKRIIFVSKCHIRILMIHISMKHILCIWIIKILFLRLNHLRVWILASNPLSIYSRVNSTSNNMFRIILCKILIETLLNIFRILFRKFLKFPWPKFYVQLFIYIVFSSWFHWFDIVIVQPIRTMDSSIFPILNFFVKFRKIWARVNFLALFPLSKFIAPKHVTSFCVINDVIMTSSVSYAVSFILSHSK